MKPISFRMQAAGFIIILLLGVTDLAAFGQSTELTAEAIVFDHPKMFLNSAELAKIKAKGTGAGASEPWETAYNSFMTKAKSVCNAVNPSDPTSVCRTPAYSVTFQGQTPPSPLTKNDYYEDRPYDGWCRKVKINTVCTAVSDCSHSPCGSDYCDSQPNPCADRADYTAMMNMTDAVRTLGLAYAFTGETRYAKKAIELIYKWALDPNTKMNPQFTSKGIQGSIDISVTMPGLFYGADLIWDYPNWTFAGVDVKAGLKAWTQQFITKAYGWSGDCYDGTPSWCQNFENWRMVFISSASVIAEDATALNYAFSKWKQLIAIQMAADGSLPQERGRSLSYSTYAVNAMHQTAEIARHYGIDLYNYKVSSTDTRGLERAFDFLAPHVKLQDPASWTYSTNTYNGANAAMYELAYAFKQKQSYMDVITKWGRPMTENRILGPETLTHAYGAYPFSGSTPSVVATPSFSPAGGTYTSAQNVAISTSTTGATIRYTLDGTTPTSTSTAYSAPIAVSSSKTIKAKAFKTGMTDSAVASATYTISSSLVNLIANPGFESGTTSWLFYTGGTGSFTAGTPAYAGSKGAKVAITTANSNIQLYQTGKTVVSGKTYKLTFTAYSNTGRDLVVHLLKDVSPYTNYGLSYTANLGTTWQTFTTQFTASGMTGTVNDGRFRFWLSGAAANDIFYIDEVKLEKIN